MFLETPSRFGTRLHMYMSDWGCLLPFQVHTTFQKGKLEKPQCTYFGYTAFLLVCTSVLSVKNWTFCNLCDVKITSIRFVSASLIFLVDEYNVYEAKTKILEIRVRYDSFKPGFRIYAKVCVLWVFVGSYAQCLMKYELKTRFTEKNSFAVHVWRELFTKSEHPHEICHTRK